MSTNPVSRVRTWGSASVIAVTLAALAVLSLTDAAWQPWVAAIVISAIGFAVLSLIVNLRNPEAYDAAWDEMNTLAHLRSLAFGYWAVLAGFVVFFAATAMGWLGADVAFYWLGPILGLAPAAHFLSSVLRGRAE